LLGVLVGVGRLRGDDASPPAATEAASTAALSKSLVVAPGLTVPPAFDKAAPEGLTDLKSMEQHVRMLSDKLKACTVSVQIGPSQGSGVIVTGDGYILTCAHVIGRPGRRVSVIFPDGTRKRGETLGANEVVDAGMIRITDSAPNEGWPHADMAEHGSIEPGDWCLAIGHPGGFRDDRPPVVRLGRVVLSTTRFLQSDCELVGGDSGGPLFDMEGRVIAINSRIQEDPTANYHVPVVAYLGGWDRLVQGEVFNSHSGALLGVSGKPVAAGVEITRVFPGEPAEVAGLLVGDVIVTFKSRKVPTLERLTELVGEENPGALVSLEILRDGKPMEITVRLGMRWD
jgi:serine protease Do